MNNDAPRRIRAALLALGALALIASASANAKPGSPLRLISPEEAALEDAPVSRGKPAELEEGPVIQLVSPTSEAVYRRPFPIEVLFRVGANGLPIDPDSIKIYYKKLWDIDITSRLRRFLGKTGITAPEVELPSGRHTVQIYIEDVERNATSKTFSVVVQEPDHDD